MNGEPKIVAEHPHSKVFYGIRPEHIQIRENGTAGKFGRVETNRAAGNLVRFFQYRRRWCPFSIEEFRDFCDEHRLGDREIELLDGLTGYSYDNGPDYGRWVGSQYIVLLPRGICAVTQNFIDRCLMT